MLGRVNPDRASEKSGGDGVMFTLRIEARRSAYEVACGEELVRRYSNPFIGGLSNQILRLLALCAKSIEAKLYGTISHAIHTT